MFLSPNKWEEFFRNLFCKLTTPIWFLELGQSGKTLPFLKNISVDQPKRSKIFE